MPATIEVDPSQVHSIEVDPGQVSAAPAGPTRHNDLAGKPKAGTPGADTGIPDQGVMGALFTPVRGVQQIAHGVERMGHPETGETRGGIADVIQGGAKVLSPYLPQAVVAAPVAAVTGAVGAEVGSRVAGAGARVLDASPGAQELSETLGGVAGGGAGASLGDNIPAIGRATLKRAAPLADRMYQSALKPSPAKGAAAAGDLVETGLNHGIPVSEEGAAKLSSLIDDLNGKIKTTIQDGANRGVTIDPKAVVTRLDDTRSKFARQVNPDADLAAIDSAKKEFLNGPGAGPIPADMAQDIKQGTYQQIRKSYGQLSSAQVEAQKALARGIREELGRAFPEINSMNAEDSKLLQLQPALDRAVARITNHDMLGLGAPVAAGAGAAIAGGPGAAAAAVLKQVLDNPGMKSKIAVAIAKGSKRAGKPVNLLTVGPRVGAYAGALVPQQDQPAP